MSALNEDARQRLLPETEKHDEEGETRIQFAYDSFDWGPQSHAKRGKKEQTKGNQHLPLVPREVWCIIASYMPVEDILRLACTNRMLRTFGNTPALWGQLLLRDFSALPQPNESLQNYSLSELYDIFPDSPASSSIRNARSSIGGYFTDTNVSGQLEPESFREVYKSKFLAYQKQGKTLKRFENSLRRERSMLLCATVWRVIADIHQVLCVPCVFSSFPLVAIVLLALKLDNSDVFGTWVVLIPLQILGLCLFSGFVQACLTNFLQDSCLTSPRSAFREAGVQGLRARSEREIQRELRRQQWRHEMETSCGLVISQMSKSSSPLCVRVSLQFTWILPLMTGIVLLSLKAMRVLPIAWTYSGLPAIVSLFIMPITLLPVLLPSHMPTCDKIIIITVTASSFLCLSLSFLLYTILVDGFANLKMWEVMLPVSIGFGVAYILVLVSIFYVQCKDMFWYGTSKLEGSFLIAFWSLMASIGFGIPISQIILFCVHYDTDLLDDSNNFELYTPTILLSILYCCGGTFSGCMQWSGMLQRVSFFSAGMCGYGCGWSEVRNRINSIDLSLRGVST